MRLIKEYRAKQVHYPCGGTIGFRVDQIRGRRIRNMKLSEPNVFTAPIREGWQADKCVWVIKFFNYCKIKW